MARHIQVTLLCDVRPHETDTPAARTVSIGIDGQRYELEVCAEHERQLLQAVTQYVQAARRVRPPGRRRTYRRTSRDRQQSREVRAWALASGRQVPERGRLPRAVRRDYAAAHGLTGS